MAKTRPTRKKKSIKKDIILVQNRAYYDPIIRALNKTDKAVFNNIGNLDVLSDSMIDSILSPYDNSFELFLTGSAKFYDYWVLTQTLCIYAHLIADALTNQKYRIYDYDPDFGEKVNDLAVEYWLEDYKIQLDKSQNEYVDVIRSIGERHKKTNKYGLTGDEIKSLNQMRKDLEELLLWCSVSMLARTITEVTKRIVGVETKILSKHK